MRTSERAGPAGALEPGGPTGDADRPAFVLGGGGNLGALQVGMAYALVERDIRPGLIVGTSVGAINGAFLSSRADLDGIAEIARFWRSLRRSDILRFDAPTALRGLVRRGGHLFDSSGLRSVLESFVGFERLEEAPIPLAVVATERGSRRAVVLESGDVVTALLASSAVPRLLPPVAHGGTVLVDGSLAADVPVRQALALGATRLFVLPTMPGQVASARDGLDGTRTALSAQLHVIPAPRVRAPMADLRHTRRLLEIGYEHALAWLDGLPTSERPGRRPSGRALARPDPDGRFSVPRPAARVSARRPRRGRARSPRA
ncbi:MAG TPA: patatin-like phospholipase family protein [Acidimicrobiales bacterium]|nr:patatin-like phospholipase family protein [Acidimicrobiales bacterium]